MTALKYLVAITATHPRSGAVSEHVTKVDAYTLNDAMLQAMIAIDAQSWFLEQQYKLKVVWISPDTEESFERMWRQLSELRLIHTPAMGTTA